LYIFDECGTAISGHQVKAGGVLRLNNQARIF
jgi:hypothetical protein